MVEMGSFSLHFRFNKRRYLFGLTNSLMDARGGLKKMQIDWVILPSQPYNVELSTFYWHLQVRCSNSDLEPSTMAQYFGSRSQHKEKTVSVGGSLLDR